MYLTTQHCYNTSKYRNENIALDYVLIIFKPHLRNSSYPVACKGQQRGIAYYSSASEHWKVVPFEMSPVCSPSLNHFMRCFDVPWLNDSGTA